MTRHANNRARLVAIVLVFVTCVTGSLRADLDLPGLSRAISTPTISRAAFQEFLSRLTDLDVASKEALVEKWDAAFGVLADAEISVVTKGIASDSRDPVVLLAWMKRLDERSKECLQREEGFKSSVSSALPDEFVASWNRTWWKSRRQHWLNAIIESKLLRYDYMPVIRVSELVIATAGALDGMRDATDVAEARIDLAIVKLQAHWTGERLKAYTELTTRQNLPWKGEREALIAVMRETWIASADLIASMPEESRSAVRTTIEGLLCPELGRSRVMQSAIQAEKARINADGHSTAAPLEELASIEDQYRAERMSIETAYAAAVYDAWNRFFRRPVDAAEVTADMPNATRASTKQLWENERKYYSKLQSCLLRHSVEPSESLKLVAEWLRAAPAPYPLWKDGK